MFLVSVSVLAVLASAKLAAEGESEAGATCQYGPVGEQPGCVRVFFFFLGFLFVYISIFLILKPKEC